MQFRTTRTALENTLTCPVQCPCSQTRPKNYIALCVPLEGQLIHYTGICLWPHPIASIISTAMIIIDPESDVVSAKHSHYEIIIMLLAVEHKECAKPLGLAHQETVFFSESRHTELDHQTRWPVQSPVGRLIAYCRWSKILAILIRKDIGFFMTFRPLPPKPQWWY